MLSRVSTLLPLGSSVDSFPVFIFVICLVLYLHSLIMIDNVFKIVCWNCRGVSGRDTSARIKQLMKQLNPFIFCLVETRADNSRLDIFCSKLGQKWAWAAIAADGFSGGLIVIWQKQLGKVSPLARSRYVLHLVVTNVKNESWILSTVYNSNHYQVQTTVWYELSGIASLNLPWILIGDFNTIASLDEFQGGSRSYYRRKARVFSDFISVNNLFDVNYTGSRFTWCNNQYGVARKWARLDRCLINSCCAAHLGKYYLKHLPRLFSDHAPLLLSLSSRIPSNKRVFSF